MAAASTPIALGDVMPCSRSGFNAENRSFQMPVATRNSAAEVSRVALAGVCSGTSVSQLRT